MFDGVLTKEAHVEFFDAQDFSGAFGHFWIDMSPSSLIRSDHIHFIEEVVSKFMDSIAFWELSSDSYTNKLKKGYNFLSVYLPVMTRGSTFVPIPLKI